MTELLWTPEQIGRLTLAQLACLLNERAPDTFAPIDSAEAWAARQEAERAEEAAWRNAP